MDGAGSGAQGLMKRARRSQQRLRVRNCAQGTKEHTQTDARTHAFSNYGLLAFPLVWWKVFVEDIAYPIRLYVVS